MSSETAINIQVNNIKLIKLVRENQCLYNPKHPKYKDIGYIEKVWKNIASMLCPDNTLSAIRCKLRWRGLRNALRRKLNIMKNPDIKCQWLYMKYMLFLVPYMGMFENPEKVNEYLLKHKEADDDIHSDFDSVTFDNNDTTKTADYSNFLINENDWQTRNNLSLDAEEKVQTTRNDPFEHQLIGSVQLNNYFDLIRDTVETFSLVQQIDVRRKIYEVVYEIEMQNALSGKNPHSNSFFV